MGILPIALVVMQPPAAPATSGSNTLTAVLPNLYWNVAARGPLIVVGPERYKQVPPGKPQPVDFFRGGLSGMMAMMGGGGGPQAEDALRAAGMLPPKVDPGALPQRPQTGWNPNDLLPRFSGQLVRCGALTAVTPQLLPDRTPKKDSSLAGEMMELMNETMASTGGSRLLPLLASLSPNQLQQATTDTGLPLGSLSSAQQRMVRALLPRSAVFRFSQKPTLPPQRPGTPAPLIPDTDQSQFALRLRRTLNLAPSMDEAGLQGPGMKIALQAGNLVLPDTVPGGTAELALKPGGRPNPMAFLSKLMGQNDASVPARRKPTDLDPATSALNAPVSLTGATTVGEMVQRIAKVTRVSVFADQRIAGLRVHTRGTTARAGDVLDALCVGLGGTCRRISDDKESVYLLTESVAIAASDLGDMAEQMMQPMMGMMQNQKKAERLAADARARLIRQKVLRQIPRRPTPDLSDRFWQVAEALPNAKNPEAGMIPVGELPRDYQDRAKTLHSAFSNASDAVKKAGIGSANVTDAKPLTSITCSQSLVAELVAPTLGAVATIVTTDASEIHPDLPAPGPPPATVLPKSLKIRALLVALPTTEEEAQKLVTVALARGVTELRVPVATGEVAEKALASLAAKAKDKLGVVPLLSPLAPEKPGEVLDRSFEKQSLLEWAASSKASKMFAALPDQLKGSMGRSYSLDYSTPESADVAGFVRRAQRLSVLPGVTGLGLENLAAPGYRDALGAANGSGVFLWQGGANDRERVAFVREQRADPAELSSVSLGDLFSTMPTRTAWTKRTTARSDAFLKRLSTALAEAKLGLPLSTAFSGEPPRWEKWQGVIPSAALPALTARPALRQLSYTRFLSAPNAFFSNDLAGLDEPDQFIAYLTKELEKLVDPSVELRWDGVLVDLSDQPLATALPLLEHVLAEFK